MGGKRQANPSCRTSWWWSPGSRRPLKQTSPRGGAFSENSVRVIWTGRLAGCVQSCTLPLVQGDIRSEEVVAQLFNGSSPEKRCSNPWAVGKPAQRNARRRYAELGGNGTYGIDHFPGSIDVAFLLALIPPFGTSTKPLAPVGREFRIKLPSRPHRPNWPPRHFAVPLFI